MTGIDFFGGNYPVTWSELFPVDGWKLSLMTGREQSVIILEGIVPC
jgi:hypothetical protein